MRLIRKWLIPFLIGVVVGAFALNQVRPPRTITEVKEVKADSVVIHDTVNVVRVEERVRTDSVIVEIPAGTYEGPMVVRIGSREQTSNRSQVEQSLSAEHTRIDSVRQSGVVAGEGVPYRSEPRLTVGLGLDYRTDLFNILDLNTDRLDPWVGVQYIGGRMPFIGGPVAAEGRFYKSNTITVGLNWRFDLTGATKWLP